jgi:hypothetical protein
MPLAQQQYTVKDVMPSSFLQLFEQYRGMLYATSLRMPGHVKMQKMPTGNFY